MKVFYKPIAFMNQELFTQIHPQKKKKVTISIDANLKAQLWKQKSTDGISISEKIEALYRTHKKAVEGISVPNYSRYRGERGKPMFGKAIRQPCGIFLTPNAIAFFDRLAKEKNSDRSQVIEAALQKIYFS